MSQRALMCTPYKAAAAVAVVPFRSASGAPPVWGLLSSSRGHYNHHYCSSIPEIMQTGWSTSSGMPSTMNMMGNSVGSLRTDSSRESSLSYPAAEVHFRSAASVVAPSVPSSAESRLKSQKQYSDSVGHPVAASVPWSTRSDQAANLSGSE